MVQHTKTNMRCLVDWYRFKTFHSSDLRLHTAVWWWLQSSPHHHRTHACTPQPHGMIQTTFWRFGEISYHAWNDYFRVAMQFKVANSMKSVDFRKNNYFGSETFEISADFVRLSYLSGASGTSNAKTKSLKNFNTYVHQGFLYIDFQFWGSESRWSSEHQLHNLQALWCQTQLLTQDDRLFFFGEDR